MQRHSHFLIILFTLFLLILIRNNTCAQNNDYELPKMRIKALGLYSGGLSGINDSYVDFGSGYVLGIDLGFEYILYKGIGLEFAFSNQYSRNRKGIFSIDCYENEFSFSRKALELNFKYRIILYNGRIMKSQIYAGIGIGYYFPGELYRNGYEFNDPYSMSISNTIDDHKTINIKYYSNFGVQTYIAYEHTFTKKLGITAGLKIRYVNYNPKEQVLTSQTSLAKDLDPLVDLGADLFIGLMIYF